METFCLRKLKKVRRYLEDTVFVFNVYDVLNSFGRKKKSLRVFLLKMFCWLVIGTWQHNLSVCMLMHTKHYKLQQRKRLYAISDENLNNIQLTNIPNYRVGKYTTKQQNKWHI